MSGAADEPSAHPIALIVALEIERRALARRLAEAAPARGAGPPVIAGRLGGRRVVVAQAGLGVERAGEAARLMAGRYGCRAVWSVGLAGGLDPSLPGGAVLVPEVVIAPDGARLVREASPGLGALAESPVHSGPLVSVASPVVTPAAKQALRAATGAIAVDMEAAGVAAAATRLGLSWLALKVVLDPAQVGVPPFLLPAAGPDGALRLSPLLHTLWPPGRLASACRFGRRSRLALHRLGEAAARALDACSP